MITRTVQAAQSAVRFNAFFTGPVTPTFTLQNRTVSGANYGLYLNLATGVWSTTPTDNPMVPDSTNAALYSSAAFDHSRFVETTSDTYALVISSHGSTNNIECEIWTFGSDLEVKIANLYDYLLAPRVEISRPDSFTVQRRFFGAKVGGVEKLRFTSHQQPGASPEEVQTNDSDLIPALLPPVVPTDVVAVAGNATVGLTWTNTGATSYNVYRAVGSASATLLASTQLPSYTDNAVVNGGVYTYTVTSMSGSAESLASTPVLASPVGVVPPAVTGFVAVAGDNTVALGWSASTGADSYDVYRADTALGTPVLLGNTTVRAWYDNTAANDSTYWYHVVAVNVWGVSAASQVLEVTPIAIIPTAPSNLGAVAGNGTVSLTWAAGVNNTTFNVYRTVGSAVPELLGNVGIAGYTDSTAVNGTTYIYTVTGVHGARESAASNTATATPVGVAPAAATNLVVTPGDATMGLVWAAAAGATGYKILRSTAGAEATQIDVSVATNYADNTVANGTSYTYAVVATNTWGDAAATEFVGGTPDFATPDVPTDLVATAGVSSVSLTWTAGANNVSFNVYRAEGAASPAFYATSNTATFTDALVNNGTLYTYTVSGVNGPKESLRSSQAAATPTGAVPDQVTGLVAVAGDSTIGLSWNSAASATRYDIHRSEAGGPFEILVSTPGVTHTDNTVENGANYVYRVVAANVWGEALPSADAFARPSAAPTVPTVPTGVVATPGNNSVVLTWTPDANTSHNVYRTSDVEEAVLVGTSVSASFTDSTAVNGTTYGYNVTGVRGSMESSMSSLVVATPISAPPVQVTNLLAEAFDAAVLATWDASSEASGYRIERSDAGATFSVIATISAESYLDEGLTNGTVYTYRVTATNALGDAPASAEVSATPTAP